MTTAAPSSAIHPIEVPASTANLGPGFDTLGIALRLYTRVRVIDVMPSKPDVLETVFADSTFTGENRIETAFKYARLHSGVPTPGLRIEVTSDIPRRAGLGSSAAAAVAGLKLYAAAAPTATTVDWLPLASEIEGHPDNAAAALLGGMTMSCQCDDGRILAHSWHWPEEVRFIVATPDVPLDTAYARSVLPASIRMRDAIFNLQRVVLFIRALETGHYEQLREAMRDRWHQPFRMPLVPALAEAMALDHPGLLGVCLSGAGPSILALVSGHETEIAGLLGATYDRLGVSHTIRTLDAHQPAPAPAEEAKRPSRSA
jgi:homoserine kinase